MKEPKLEKEIMKIIEKYKTILFLEKYSIDLGVLPATSKSVMECEFNYPYLDVTISYGDQLIKKWKDKEDITQTVVHELCHIITDPLYCKAIERYVGRHEINDEREMLTDYIANIVTKNGL